MIEHEHSYVFTCDEVWSVLDKAGIPRPLDSKLITDYYLSPTMRVRNVSGSHVSVLTKKTGDKSTGSREEIEATISKSSAALLSHESHLKIEKDRYNVNFNKEYRWNVTVDIVKVPMKVAIVEVESINPLSDPSSVSEKLFGEVYNACPLSAWDFFKRKIGICGGPSSGKTETARNITHLLNTKMGANCWHVSEYASSFIQKYRRNPQFEDQLMVYLSQSMREQEANLSNVVISDCPTFLSYIYALALNRSKLSSESSLFLSKIYKRVLFEARSYSDIVFLKMQEYIHNGIRFQDYEEAKNIENRIEGFLKDHGIPHHFATYNDSDAILKKLFYINK